MIQIIIVVILAGLGFYLWRAWKRESAGAASGQRGAPVPSLSEAGIEQVRAGGMIQLPPHGEAMDSCDVQITARHVYEEDGFQWFELEGDSGAGTVWLEVAHDDELETSVSLARLTPEDIGLSEAALQALGSTDGVKHITHAGQQFKYVERGQAHFYPAGDTQRGEAFSYWDFEGDDDQHDLGIESWDGQYRVYLSQRINPARIRIYSLGEDA